MIILVAVNNFECLAATRREEKIVTPHVVSHDREHWSAAIGIKDVAGAEISRARVIEAASAREPFRFVRARKRDQIGHLRAFKIDYPQQLTFRDLKRRACP